MRVPAGVSRRFWPVPDGTSPSSAAASGAKLRSVCSQGAGAKSATLNLCSIQSFLLAEDTSRFTARDFGCGGERVALCAWPRPLLEMRRGHSGLRSTGLPPQLIIDCFVVIRCRGRIPIGRIRHAVCWLITGRLLWLGRSDLIEFRTLRSSADSKDGLDRVVLNEYRTVRSNADS